MILYIALAILAGRAFGWRFAAHRRPPVRIAIQIGVAALLIYLPVWDYVPAHVAFSRYAEKSCGLQVKEVVPADARVLLEGRHRGYCVSCVTALSTDVVRRTQGLVEEPDKDLHPTGDGVFEYYLVDESDPACAPFDAYLAQVPQYASLSPSARRHRFWEGNIYGYAGPEIVDRCVASRKLEAASADLVLTERSGQRVPFLASTMLTERIALIRPDDRSELASYSVARYMPWLNAYFLRSFPLLFDLHCPEQQLTGYVWQLYFLPPIVFATIRWQADEAAAVPPPE